MALAKRLLFLFLFASPVFAAQDTIQSTVCFQDPQGNCLANGTLTFDLSQPARITSGGGQVAPLRVSVTLDSTGKIPAGTLLWGNDQLTPSGTTYLLRVYNSNGLPVSIIGTVIIQGTSPIDLSLLTPVSVSPAITTNAAITTSNNAFTGNNTHSGTETFTSNLDTKYLGATRYVCNRAGTSTGWAGADVSVWTNAAIAEVITAGGGTVDATSCGGTQTVSQEIDVGNGSSVPVKLLLPHTGTWLISITDGVSYGIKVFHQSTVLGSNAGYGSFQLRPSSTSTSVGAFVGNDTSVANAHIRVEGFEANVFATLVTVNKAVCYFSGLADVSFIRNMSCANLGSVNATKVLWVNNSCCGTTFDDVVADAFSVAGVTPCFFGNGTTGPNLNVRFDGISCVHPGNGASNVVDQQWNQFGNNTFRNIYMEMCPSACFQALTDTTTPWISVQKFGTPTAADVFFGVTAGGDVAASTRYTMDIASGSHIIVHSLEQGGVSTNAINDHNSSTTLTTPINTTVGAYSTEKIYVTPGSQATPSIVNFADPTTGIYFSAADHSIRFNVNGLNQLSFTASGANGTSGGLVNRAICWAGTGASCLDFQAGTIATVGTDNPIFSIGAGGIAPTTVNTVDLGTAALPFRKLFFGTAATNNFIFTPAATAAARTVNIPDPLQATTTLPLVIANGTKALNTASITTATCDAGVAATATGTLSTDAVDWSFNAAPTATNKYGAFLVVYAVPSANTVTFYTCNPSATTSTPTAMTVNWSVRRP